MPIIEMSIECPDCKGTGLYQGMGEGSGTAVVCTTCKGTGEYHYKYHYNEFKGRQKVDDVERVYKSGGRYRIGLGEIDFDGVGLVDMDQEGVSYSEFLAGDMPNHIKKLGCPMLADQRACHKIDGFVDKCMDLNGGWIENITSCQHQRSKSECWKRFTAE